MATESGALAAGQSCAYEYDWPWKLVVAIAPKVGWALNKITLGIVEGKATPLTCGAAVFLVFEAVLVVTAWVQGNLAGADGFLDDRMGLIILVLLPLAVAFAFRFYDQVYLVLRETWNRAQMSRPPGETDLFASADEFALSVISNCNSRVAAAVSFGVSAAAFSLWLASGKEQSSWTALLPKWCKIYAAMWLIMVAWSLLSFCWKAFVVWHAVDKLIVRVQRGDADRECLINVYHPDGHGGLLILASLWLNVNYIVVMAGIVFLGVAFQHKPSLSDPAFWAVPAYLVLAPLLFWGPFWRIHLEMAKAKQQELAVCTQKWEEAWRKGLDMGRVEYERVRRLPTWPFNGHVGARFASTLAIPFLVPLFRGWLFP